MKKHSLAQLAFARRLRSLQKTSAQPILCQERVFKYLIRMGRETEWGRAYGYDSISSYKDFCSSMPVSTYEDLQPYIERLLRGEHNLLWPEKINYFSKSSGTTGSKSKYIPVSGSALRDCHYRGGRNLFASYFSQCPNSNLLLGQNFALGGSRQDDGIGAGKYIADVSVILMKNLPWWAKLRRSPHFRIASMPEWEEKLTRISESIAYENIVSISGVPSWNLVLARRILELSGKKNLREVWPNLELFIHGGTSFEPYRRQFEELMPGIDMNFLEVYNASEGFFAFQDDLSRDDMLLFLDGGIFYEFIPLSEVNSGRLSAISLSEVEENKDYALLISTNAGLWRYLIGDTVRFTSLNPYRIKVSGRTKSFINACGEELSVANADTAMAAACQEHGASVREYTAAPLYNETGAAARHQWLLEFAKPPINLSSFIISLDKQLQSLNSDYEAKRYKDFNLAAPLAIQVEEGFFYSWLQSRRKLGGQAKIPRLSNNREIIEEMLATLSKGRNNSV